MARRNWTQMARGTFLKAQLHETMEDIEAARAKGSATVLANLRRLAIEIRTELDEMAKVDTQADPEEELTEGELVQLLIDSVRHLPIEQVEALAAVVELRLGIST